jgi:hypothetical protein
VRIVQERSGFTSFRPIDCGAQFIRISYSSKLATPVKIDDYNLTLRALLDMEGVFDALPREVQDYAGSLEEEMTEKLLCG